MSKAEISERMTGTTNRRTRIFTWHIHGSYLYYLSKGPFEIFIPVDPRKQEGYIGRGNTFPFGENVREIPASEVKTIGFDCILYQTETNYLTDRFEVLSDGQRRLPAIFLEHDPPQQAPTETKHVAADDPQTTIVHVTYFNKLMWDNGRAPAYVIDHGIPSATASYNGELERGIVVINNLKERGRRLGYDIFEHVRQKIPLDLIGMDTLKIGGLGEILHPQLPAFVSKYRFFFSPIRYTSLGLAVLEAMTIGIPVVALATTELVTVIENGKSGVVHTDVDYLIRRMESLLSNKHEAAMLGTEGRKIANERFNLERFVSDWRSVIEKTIRSSDTLQHAEIVQETL